MPDVIVIDAITGERIERDFTPEEAAQRAVDQAEAQAAAELAAGLDANRSTLTQRAAAALAANRAYVDNPSPTTAESIAQVKALTRQNTAIIRLLLGLVEETD